MQFFACTNTQNYQTEYFIKFNKMNNLLNIDNKKIIKEFEDAMLENPIKTKPYFEKAKNINSQAVKLVAEIETIKLDIFKTNSISLSDIKNLKDQKYKIPKSKIEHLEKEFLTLKNNYLEIIEKKQWDEGMINLTNNLLDNEKWLKLPIFNKNKCNSEKLLTILTKMQFDILYAENSMLNYQIGRIASSYEPFYMIEAFVMPESREVLLGDEYKAKIFLATYDTTKAPLIIINSKQIPIFDGKGIYKKKTRKIGTHYLNGVIKIKKPGTDEIIDVPFETEYVVK